MSTLTTSQSLAFAGCISSTVLSGVNFSASQLTLPILYRLPAATSSNVFEELFWRGGYVIVPLTFFSTIMTASAAYLEPSKRWAYALAAFASFASLPWTGTVMRPTIQLLIKHNKDEKYRQGVPEDTVIGWLKKWTWMNNVRSTLALIGGVGALYVLVAAA